MKNYTVTVKFQTAPLTNEVATVTVPAYNKKDAENKVRKAYGQKYFAVKILS